MPLAEADRSGAPSSHARGLSGSFASHWLPWLRVWMTQMTSRSMAQRSLAPERQPKAHGPGGVLGQPGVTDQPRPSWWTGRSHADAARNRWAAQRRRAHEPGTVEFLIVRKEIIPAFEFAADDRTGLQLGVMVPSPPMT